MGDVAVDTADLAHVRARLEDLASQLEAAGARLAAGDALAVGARRMVVALERAQQDWQLHVASLRLLAHVAARDLGTAATAYAECEAGAQRLLAGAAAAVTAPGGDVGGGPPVVPPAAATLGPPVPPAAAAAGLGPPVPPVPAVAGPPTGEAGR